VVVAKGLKALRYGTGDHVPSITECAVSEAQTEVPTATTATLEDEGAGVLFLVFLTAPPPHPSPRGLAPWPYAPGAAQIRVLFQRGLHLRVGRANKRVLGGLPRSQLAPGIRSQRAKAGVGTHPTAPGYPLGLRRRGWGRLLGARSKTGAKHRKRVPPTETHKRGIGPVQKTHRKGHRKMASIDHIDSLCLVQVPSGVL
jgi:hypothetical protein